MKAMVGVLAAVTLASCSTAPALRIPGPHPRTLVGWRLAERRFGEVDERWAAAADGEIPADQIVLVHEPVYRNAETHAGGLVKSRSTCDHRVRIERRGPETRRIGEPARVTVWIESDGKVGHVVVLEPTSRRVSITRVEGVEPVPGRPCRFLFPPGARAEVIFTAIEDGAAGIRVSVDEEFSLSDGLLPARRNE